MTWWPFETARRASSPPTTRTNAYRRLKSPLDCPAAHRPAAHRPAVNRLAVTCSAAPGRGLGPRDVIGRSYTGRGSTVQVL